MHGLHTVENQHITTQSALHICDSSQVSQCLYIQRNLHMVDSSSSNPCCSRADCILKYMYVHTQKFYKWVTDFMHFRIFLEQGWESHTPWTPVSWDYITQDLLHWFKAWLSGKVHSICLKAGHSFSPWAVPCWQRLVNTSNSSLSFPHGLWRCILLSHLDSPSKTHVQGKHVDVLYSISASAGKAQYTYTA